VGSAAVEFAKAKAQVVEAQFRVLLPEEDVNQLVPNGGFDSDLIWTEVGTANIAGGVAHFANDLDEVNQGSMVMNGVTYRVTFTILNYVGGGARAVVGGTLGTTRTANGTYVQDIIGTLGNGEVLGIRAVGATNLDIDNVSVYPIYACTVVDS
jgi:hypothetical protein